MRRGRLAALALPASLPLPPSANAFAGSAVLSPSGFVRTQNAFLLVRPAMIVFER